MPTKTRTIAAQIDEIKAAITATEASTDPRFLARPAARAELIENLQERVAWLQAAEAAAVQTAAERAETDRRAQAWTDLEPRRRDLVGRWADLQQQMAAILRDAERLDADHQARTGRRALSEPVTPRHLIAARLELADARILVRPTVF